MKYFSFLFILLIYLSACSAPTRIESFPSEARVWVDGSYVGQTPIELDISPKSRDVTFTYPGYPRQSYRLETEYDARSLFALPVFPLLLLEDIRNKPAPLYRVYLDRDYTVIIDPETGEATDLAGKMQKVQARILPPSARAPNLK